jgi:hypothetical protein
VLAASPGDRHYEENARSIGRYIDTLVAEGRLRNEKGLFRKKGSLGADDKSFTLYVGSLEDAREVATMLEANVGHLLRTPRPGDNTYSDDRPFTARVWGRFATARIEDLTVFRSNGYGRNGIPQRRTYADLGAVLTSAQASGLSAGSPREDAHGSGSGGVAEPR